MVIASGTISVSPTSYFLRRKPMLALGVAAASARLHRLGIISVFADGLEHGLEPSAEALCDVLDSTGHGHLHLL